jgi:hypothetical protein
MAEAISNNPRRYLNQFKNRNIVTTVIDVSEDVLNVMSDFAMVVSRVTSSVAQVSESLGGVSNSLASQSLQITTLEDTARSLGTNKLFSNKETPIGAIDGVNTTYTLAHSPILGSDHVYLNGVLIEDQNNDYSISGPIITFSNPLLEGMKLACTYYYESSAPVIVFKDKEQPSGLIDGVNKIFTLIYTPVEQSEHIYLNGVLQENGGDYDMSGSVITFREAPLQSMKLRCTYYYIL